MGKQSEWRRNNDVYITPSTGVTDGENGTGKQTQWRKRRDIETGKSTLLKEYSSLLSDYNDGLAAVNGFASGRQKNKDEEQKLTGSYSAIKSRQKRLVDELDAYGDSYRAVYGREGYEKMRSEVLRFGSQVDQALKLIGERPSADNVDTAADVQKRIAELDAQIRDAEKNATAHADSQKPWSRLLADGQNKKLNALSDTEKLRQERRELEERLKAAQQPIVSPNHLDKEQAQRALGLLPSAAPQGKSGPAGDYIGPNTGFIEGPSLRPATTMDNLKALGTDVLASLSNASDDIWRGIDWLVPDEMLNGGDNGIRDFFDSMYAANKQWNTIERNAGNRADPVVRTVGDYVVQPVVQSLPSAAVAMMSGGASTAPSIASASGGALSTSLKSMAKNPSFWMSAIPTFGSTYEGAIQEGASELEATATALLNAFAGSVIEIGGGIETIPNSSLGIRDWVRGMLDEGKEEVLQGIVENLAKKALYDSDREWFSANNPDAVINPARMLQEAAGGALVGGILGGAEIGLGRGINAHRQKAIGEAVIQDGQVYNAIRAGFEADVNSPAYRAAVELSQRLVNGEAPRPAEVGALVSSAREAGGRGSTARPEAAVAARAAAFAQARAAGLDPTAAVADRRVESRAQSAQTGVPGGEPSTDVTRAPSRVAGRGEPITPIRARATVETADGGKPVTVTGLDSVSERGVTVALDGGETASISQVQFENPQVQSLYSAAEDYETNTAKAFVAGYDGTLSLRTYQTAFDFLHGQAMRGVPFETAVEQAGLVGKRMGLEARYLAYQSGINAAAALQKSGGRGTMETAPDGRARGESRADFLRRGAGRQVDVHGRDAIAYTKAAAVPPDSEAGKAAAAFETGGIRAVVTKGAFETNRDGVTTRHADAATAPDGTVYIVDSTKIPAAYTVSHESVHVLQKQGSPAYDGYYEALVANVDWMSNGYEKIAKEINDNYHGGKLNVQDLDSAKPLFTELTAYIHERLATNPALAEELFSGMFRDWEAVVQADRQLTEFMESDGKQYGRFQGAEDVRGIGGTTHGHPGENGETRADDGGRAEKNAANGREVHKVVSQSVQGGQETASVRRSQALRRGVTRATAVQRLTPVQRKQIAVLDAYGKAHGLSFVLVDTIEDGRANGQYRDGVITIALDAQESGYLVTAGHEVFHYLEDRAPAEAARLREYINAELKKTMGAAAYEALVDERMAQYNTTDRLAVESEIAANGLFDVFRSETAVQRLVQTNRALALKVRTALTSFVQELNTIIAKLAGGREEIAALQGNAGALREIARRFDAALQAAQDTKNAAPKGGGDRYQLVSYTAHQKENWAGSKSIVVYENCEQLAQFIDDALKSDTSSKKMYFGKINNQLAQRIYEDTGVSVLDYNCVLRANEIKKILKNSHGDPQLEALRGQKAITKEDLMRIPEIIQSPDTVSLDTKLFEGKPVLLFTKTENSRTTVVSYVSRKHLDLTVQTMYASKKKGNLATTPGENTLFLQTSETLSGTVPNNSVSQKDTTVNTSISNLDKHDAPKYSLKTAAVDSDTTALTEGQRRYFLAGRAANP